MVEFGNPLSAAFWAGAPADSPLSYQALQTRRKIAEQLMGKRSPFPKTFGEGLTYAGERFADVMDMNRLDAAEKAQSEREAGIRAGYPQFGTAADTNTAVAPAGQPTTRPVSDAGTDTTAPVQTAAAPYSAPGAAPGNIPLPPPRPARLRDAQLAQLQEDPAVLRRAAAMTQGEVDPRASTAERQTQFASALDRAGARNIPVAQALETYTGPGSRGYYPPDAFARGEQALQKPGAYEAFQRDIATPVLRGADPGAAALGFTPTGNASGGVASRGIARGLYNASGRFPGSAETYVQQEPPSQLARLEAGRNRMAAAAMPDASQPVQTAALTTPGVASDAGPASAIADGASTAIAALPTQAQPPTQAPPLIPGSGPPIQSTIPKATPQQTAQAAPPAIVTAQSLYGEGIPERADTTLPHPGERPKPPDIPKPTKEMMYWQRVHGSDVSPQTQEYAKEQYAAHAENQKRAYDLSLNEYYHKRGKYDTDLSAHQKSVIEKPVKDLEQDALRLKNALSRETDPLTITKLRQDIKKNDVDYAQALKTLNEQKIHTSQGAFYREQQAVPEIPGVQAARPGGGVELVPGSPEATKTESQQKAAVFKERVKDDLLAVQSDPKYGKALANSPFSSFGSKVGGWVGLQNVPVTDEYRQATNRFGNWGAGFLNYVSGATVTPGEAVIQLPAFIPKYGDDDAEIARKIQRMTAYTDAVASGSGDTKNHAEAMQRGRDMIMQENGELPPVRIRPNDKPEDFGAGQRVILPDGRMKTIPWPKHLLPK